MLNHTIFILNMLLPNQQKCKFIKNSLTFSDFLNIILNYLNLFSFKFKRQLQKNRSTNDTHV